MTDHEEAELEEHTKFLLWLGIYLSLVRLFPNQTWSITMKTHGHDILYLALFCVCAAFFLPLFVPVCLMSFRRPKAARKLKQKPQTTPPQCAWTQAFINSRLGTNPRKD